MKDNQSEWEACYGSGAASHKNLYPFDRVIRFVKRNFPNQPPRRFRCLDFGCGWGNNLKFLVDNNHEAYGMDISKTAIEHVKMTITTNVRLLEDPTRLPAEDSFFDFIIDREAVQHNPREDQRRIFAEFHRTLKPGGKLLSVMMKSGDNGFSMHHPTTEDLQEYVRPFASVKIKVVTESDVIVRNADTTEAAREIYVIEAAK